jgi:hypothetical protein
MFLNVINKTIPLNKKRQISPCKWKKRGFRGVAPDPDRGRKHPCKGLISELKTNPWLVFSPVFYSKI